MVRANKIRINKYKSEYIIKLIGIYIRQKRHLTVNSISTKMGDINGENFKMNYTKVNHLVRFYDKTSMDKIATASGAWSTDTKTATTDTITKAITETGGITTTTETVDTVEVATITATVAAVRDRPEEVRVVETQSVTGMDKAARL